MWRVKTDRWGAISAVNDKLIFISGLGKVSIIEANPEEYTPIKELQVLAAKDHRDNWCWTAPTFIDGKLFVRNSKGEFACINLKE